MIKSKNEFVSYLFLLFCFSFPITTQSWDPRPTVINIGFAGLVLSVASICRLTPPLYSKSKGEGCASLIERRINTLKFILENPTEDQLIPFKNELQRYYKEILENRSLLSMIFEHDIPQQPWALLDVEIKQHLHELDFWKSLLSNKRLVNPEDVKYMLDKIEDLSNSLIDIRNHLQSHTSYQIECSLARQENYLHTMTALVTALFFSYMVNQEIDSLWRHPNLYAGDDPVRNIQR